MHKRFRGGLQQMILWYGQHDRERLAPSGEEPDTLSRLDEDDEDDVDIVLVLVTHSAGCNALMGALTNQPVLLDAGMASLTMAIRKSEEPRSQSPEPMSSGARRRRSSVDLGLSELFEVSTSWSIAYPTLKVKSYKHSRTLFALSDLTYPFRLIQQC